MQITRFGSLVVAVAIALLCATFIGCGEEEVSTKSKRRKKHASASISAPCRAPLCHRLTYAGRRSHSLTAIVFCDRALKPALIDRRRVALGEPPLVPVGIGRRDGAGRVQPGDLLRRQVPADRAQVLPQAAPRCGPR